MASEGLPVQAACRLLGVAESGYYLWRSRPLSQRAIRHAWLLDQIRGVHAASRGTYGARRVHAELTLGLGIRVGHNQVEMLMARAAVKGLPGTRRARPKHQTPTAGDLVNRSFARKLPNQLWVTDITEHFTREGKVYCAVVLDVFSRRVVGWSIDSTQTAALVTNALGMAISNRAPEPGTLIHSDHGTQFTCWAFTDRARKSGLVRRWVRSVTATTMPASNHCGADCKPCFSTGSAGELGSSSRTRFSSTWRSSTIVRGATRLWVCGHRSNTR